VSWFSAGSLALPTARHLRNSSTRSSGPGIAEHHSPIDPRSSPDASIILCGARHTHSYARRSPGMEIRRNGLQHARLSERQLNTAAKTGLPAWSSRPLTGRLLNSVWMSTMRSAAAAGAVFVPAATRGARAGGSAARARARRKLSYAAWKSLQLKPLPPGVAPASATWLRPTRPARCGSLHHQPPANHDQLQAIVGGLPGLLWKSATRRHAHCRQSAASRTGHWREGFIVVPLPPRTPSSVRWLTKEPGLVLSPCL